MSQLENNTSTLQTLLSTIETMEVMPNSVEQAIPTIEISSGGLITVSATQGAGVVAAGTKTNTKQITNANLVAENIKEGVSIFGVTGNIEPKEFTINTTVESGATVTATSGSTTVTGTSNGTCVLKVPSAGTWTVKATTQLDEWNDELETSNSKSVVTVDTHSTSLTFWRAYIDVATEAGAEVTCTNGTKTYTAIAPDTGEVTFRVISTGNWSVTAVGASESDTLTVSVTEAKTYALSILGGISSTLNNNEWSIVRELSDAGTAANYWAVGDTHEVTINGTVGQTTFSNLSVYAFILGFDHNSSREGTNRIHFQIGKTAQMGGTDIALIDSKYNSYPSTAGYFNMNYSDSNSGGWESCKMRTVLLGSSYTPSNPRGSSLLAALPSDLRTVMKSCTKYSDNTGGISNTASYVTSTTDYLWLLAEYEVFGTRTSANSAEQNYQQQYTYYANGNSKKKYQHSSTSSAVSWWLRSPDAKYGRHFGRVHSDGTFNPNFAYASQGVAPAFCV